MGGAIEDLGQADIPSLLELAEGITEPSPRMSRDRAAVPLAAVFTHLVPNRSRPTRDAAGPAPYGR